jgi:hypothetical protein
MVADRQILDVIPVRQTTSQLAGLKVPLRILRAFVQHPPHLRIMVALAPHMDETKFVRWTVKGSRLPLQWDEALPRLSGASPAQTSHVSGSARKE